MKIIDFHTHTFPPDLAPRAIKTLIDNAAPTVTMKNYTDGTTDGLLDSMRKSGVDVSVTLSVATKSSQVHTINADCAKNTYPELIRFGTLYPDMEEFEAEIDFLTDSGIKGIKLHPEYQNCYIDDPKYFPIYEKLASSGLIVLTHAGKDPGPFTNDHALPRAIRAVHENFPTMKLVAAHLGGWTVWDDVENTLAGIDIYFDTSAIYKLIAPEQFVRICRKHGMEKILFGSDCPWYDQGASVDWIKKSGLNDNELETVFYKNANNLLQRI